MRVLIIILVTAAIVSAIAGIRLTPCCKYVMLVCAVLLTVLQTPASAEDVYRLSNNKLCVRISAKGYLLSVENRTASERYDFESDGFALKTDLGTFTSSGAADITVRSNKRRIIFRYKYDGPKQSGIILEMTYNLEPSNGFFRRALRVANDKPLRVENLRMGKTIFASLPDETIHYLTFWMSPTVEFIRFARGGLFTGIENPFYRADLDVNGVALSFEPGLILKSGEGYESEPQFIGVYKRSGVMIEDSGRPFRYPNGSGYIPIDRNECRAMRAYALDYLAPEQDRFLNINYQFFHPLPQMVFSDADMLWHTKAIDTFSDINGDMIIFNPLYPYKKPTESRPYWDLISDDPASPSYQVVDYARNKNISYGFYMGCAKHGDEGNAAGLPFVPERLEWKKMDAHGNRASDNCIGCDDFYDWWFRVQDNTIKKYALGNWSWDPSRGTAMNCYDELHGHIAGKGAYKGWRRCMELGKRLKESNPGLFIQAFYGTKQFGLWGLKDVDGHEVYNEQTAIVSTHHTQISDDRQNADGLRFQNYWSMRFRFLPTIIGHPLVGRMGDGGWDPELVKACDYYGWQYSLMSALAISGSIMPSILPYESDILPGYKEFYSKWTAWAKETFDLVQYTEPFGEQVQPGAVDGYARIKDDHGFIFLFNGNPRPSQITFEVGDEINLHKKGCYEFIEIYPLDKVLALDDNKKSIFSLSDFASMTIPSNSCRLLELRRVSKPRTVELVGVPGHVEMTDNCIEITRCSGNPGQVYEARIRLREQSQPTEVKVNGVKLPFTKTGNEIALFIKFDGNSYTRELNNWTKTDGARFDFPNDNRIDRLQISTSFDMNSDIPQLLENAKPKNWAEMESKIVEWQNSGIYSFHNFVCCRPARLWLVIPFMLQRVGEVKLFVNEHDVSDILKQDRYGNSLYADVTDLLIYGSRNTIGLILNDLESNEFMGPYLLYPNEAETSKVSQELAGITDRVVYSGSLAAPIAPRYQKGIKSPVITKAFVTGNVTLSKPTQLKVKVDLPPDQIREVKYTESGFPWMGIHDLNYNSDTGYWEGLVIPGPRKTIPEFEYIYIWAVRNDGLHSDYYPVKVGWDFIP